jgi:regulator of sigma E protease
MTTILSILGVILILSFLVVIHEWGHYIAAKKNGIQVDEFAIGFPPTLYSWKGKGKSKGTTFKINLVPFGGYVKLHGEDATNSGLFKDKKSFASKTPWQKVEVVCAGVIMNFLVFWVLMSVSMMIGVSPLITSSEEFRDAFKEGVFKAEPYVLVEDVKVNSLASEDGIVKGDKLVAVNGKDLDLAEEDLANVLELTSDTDVDLSFERSGSVAYLVNVSAEDFNKDYGLDFYPVTSLPVAKVTGVESELLAENLQVGDLVTEINDMPIFDIEDVLTSVYDDASLGNAKFEVLRDKEKFEFEVPVENRQIVTGFLANSVAEEAGIQVGDRITMVEDTEVFYGDYIPDIVGELDGVISYTVERDGEQIFFELTPDENGLIGVSLAPEIKVSDYTFDFQPQFILSSVVEMELIKEPFYKAPITALSEGTKIAGQTAKAFLGTLGDVATKLEVSDEVGGPVQVAKLGFEFVQTGGVDLLSFIALISLSLAVINILPIPALDGGRLLFIIIEAFRGKPLNPRAEALIHYLGFWLLIAFIVVVTFYDIVRI